MSRKPQSRIIRAPASYPPVHDCNRIAHGGRWPGGCGGDCEMMPHPMADREGSVVLVGEERETWHVAADGWWTGPAGQRLGMREAAQMMLKRGARLMFSRGSYGSPLVRAHLGAPLLPADQLPEQLPLFGKVAA